MLKTVFERRKSKYFENHVSKINKKTVFISTATRRKRSVGKVEATVSMVFEHPPDATSSGLMKFANDAATNSTAFKAVEKVYGLVIAYPKVTSTKSTFPMRSFIRQDNSIEFEPLTFTNITYKNPSVDPEGLWKLYDFDANTLYCVTFSGDGMPKVNACKSEVYYSWTSAIDSDYFG